jgi:hypothetical protein
MKIMMGINIYQLIYYFIKIEILRYFNSVEIENYVTDLVKSIMNMCLKNSQTQVENKKKRPFDNIKSKVFTNRVTDVSKPINKPITAKPVTRPQTAKPVTRPQTAKPRVIGFGSSAIPLTNKTNTKPLNQTRKTSFMQKNKSITKKASEVNNHNSEIKEKEEEDLEENLKFKDKGLMKMDQKIKEKKERAIVKRKRKDIKNEEIRTKNDDKANNNFCKISRWLHITIMLFLDEREIIKLGAV